MKCMFLILTIFILCTRQVQVSKADQCDSCFQFKSSFDCQNNSQFRCTWSEQSSTFTGSCSLRVDSPQPYIPSFCTTILDPLKCAQQRGCAFFDYQCVPFSGCSAYIKFTTNDCQAISQQCMTNGEQCTDVLECKDYSKEQCQSAITKQSPYRCVLDGDTCRNYQCHEAGKTLRTNQACNAWLSGCKSTGNGCTDVLKSCSEYTGTSTTCPTMIGTDGKCEFDVFLYRCRSRTCTDAPQNLLTDTACAAYKFGCVTTGQGCIVNRSSCSSYYGDEMTCVGYLGIDGYCAGDARGKQCRARKCEEKSALTLLECETWKSGCLFNGKSCVPPPLGMCSTFIGNTITCKGFIGSDGFCKGQSTKDAPCLPKDCLIDQQGNETADLQCQKIQLSCKTTGRGCVEVLSPCSSYTDDGTSCLSLVGSDGKCKAGEEGKCDVKLCTDASISLQTHSDCQTFQNDCISTGAGCIAKSTCTDAENELTCAGNTNCFWNAICVNNISCSEFIIKSQCDGKVVNNIPCIWTKNACRSSICSDFSGTTDSVCADFLFGCVSNGTDCVDGTDCNQFKGTQTMCQNFKAKCTNLTNIIDETIACIPKTCDDSHLTFTNDEDCENYLSGCVTKGIGCIQKLQKCWAYSGTPDQCDKFKGDNGSIRCWNTAPLGSCDDKQCSQASGMKDNAECEAFLSGCLYDGNGSCIEKTAACSAYTGDAASCPNFSGSSGTHICYDDPSSSKCKNKVCRDNTTATSDSDCGKFLNGCVTNGTGCIESTSACNAYSGTTAQCNKFTGNKIQCTRLELCAAKSCANKTDAADNAACLAYHSTCRLQQGTTTCMAAPGACTGFNNFATGATDPQKLAYCNSVKTSAGDLCGYDSTANSACAARVCKLWDASLTGVTCADYAGTASCRLDGDGKCYAPDTCANYVIPGAKLDPAKITYCNSVTDNTKSASKCTYDSTVSTTNCSVIDSCEEVPSPTSAADCNLKLKVSNCQFYNGMCYTTKTSCSLYSLSSVTSNQQTYCAAFKQVDSGSILQCAYLASIPTNCVNSCSAVVTPSSQADCDIFQGCKFYSSVCYIRVSCASYTFPSSVNTDVLKQLFCQNMYDGSNNKFCSWDITTKICAAPKASCTAYTGLSGTDAQKLAYCKTVRDQTGTVCDFLTGSTACRIPTSSSIKCSLLSASMTNEYECDIRTLPFCKSNGTACTTVASCAEHNVTGITNQLGACQSKMDSNLNYCTYLTGTVCDAGKTACTDWNALPSTGQASFCSSRIDKTGAKCSWTSGSNCVLATAITCNDIANPKAQVDCDYALSGCTFNLITQTCYVKQTNCNLFVATGSTVVEKVNYCKSFQNSNSNQCTYLNGNNCINYGACSTYDVTLIKTKPEKVSACQGVETSDVGCTFYGSGNSCIVIKACSSYTGGDSSTCNSLRSTNKFCTPITNANAATDCTSFTVCEDIPNPQGIADCNLYVSGCIFYQNKCITPKSDCKYAYNGIAAKIYCSGLTNSNGDFCTAAANNSVTCQNRTCSDPETKQFFTHLQCQDYIQSCKSNGIGCVDASITCAQQSGNPGFCTWALDADNKSTCLYGTPSQVPDNCIDFDCGQNVFATTDESCIKFNSNCLTKGNGCISQFASCDEYQGTKITCATFTGNGKKCWNDSEGKAACRNMICTDIQIATKQQDCETQLSGCIYNGQNCVDINASCSEYFGTQMDCASYFGKNKTQYCWGSSMDTTGRCSIRKCSDKLAQTDAECDSFLPSSNSATPNCITNGTSCVEYGKPCSYFSGNDYSCAKFTSNEGICKASRSSTTSVPCAPRLCHEASNSYTTDSQCDSYQKGCKTTGRGCKASLTCNDLQTQSVCSANIGCLWSYQCRSQAITCSSLTTSGQTVCANTLLLNGKSCTWYNGSCRDSTCEDYESSIVSHEDCQKKDIKCTTSGAGCVTLGACSSYKLGILCNSAYTTDASIRCTWNPATISCRQRKCEDANFTTDDACNKFLAGCKSSGSSCIGSTYGCNVFTRSPNNCLQNSSGQPCLRVNDICYDFDDCTDAPFNDLVNCQKFSPLCVPNNFSCMAMTFCEKYQNQISCIIGLSKTICGWMPTGKCAIYTNCEDAAGVTLQDCINWNSKCVSDGTKCINQGTCASYGNETACGNAGTDGLCKWTGSTCRLRECGDNIAVTDTDCAAYTVAAGICTTDGTKCVLRAACSAYTEQGCFYGSDGIPCVFDSYWPGGTKFCRPKECEDIKGTSNDQCIGQIPNKKCVSDGKMCIKKNFCGAYRNRISCQAGGSDAVCVFTPAATTTDPYAGRCAVLKSCADANYDKDACQSKPKQCKWTSVTSGSITTTSCTAMDCASAAQGTNCVAVPNFNNTSFTICVLINGVCTAGDPSSLTEENCYKSTVYSYTWNESTNKCVSCKGITTPSNNSTTANNSTTNDVNSTTTATDSNYILGFAVCLSILEFFI